MEHATIHVVFPWTGSPEEWSQIIGCPPTCCHFPVLSTWAPQLNVSNPSRFTPDGSQLGKGSLRRENGVLHPPPAECSGEATCSGSGSVEDKRISPNPRGNIHPRTKEEIGELQSQALPYRQAWTWLSPPGFKETPCCCCFSFFLHVNNPVCHFYSEVPKNDLVSFKLPMLCHIGSRDASSQESREQKPLSG